MSDIKQTTYPAIFWWRPACWLRVGGPDTANFLQGQFSNDLRTLQPGEAVYGLWLTLKGKILADAFILGGATADEFWVGSYFSPAAVVRERLESFLIADDVTVEDVTAAWSAVSVSGAARELVSDRVGFRFAGRRTGEPNLEWVFPVAAESDVRARFAGLPALGAEEIERGRIAAGIPAVPRDAGPADLPHEAGLEEVAISYTKGCYLGQEVMARLKAMGQVRRKLCRVHAAAGNVPATPAPLFIGERQVGDLRSAAADPNGGFCGLAMLSLLHVKAESRLSLGRDAAPDLRLLDVP